jgi:hypothetical protein
MNAARIDRSFTIHPQADCYKCRSLWDIFEAECPVSPHFTGLPSLQYCGSARRMAQSRCAWKKQRYDSCENHGTADVDSRID